MPLSPTTSRGGAGGITLLSYVEFTADVTISSTSAAAMDTIVTAASVTVSGSTLICVEVYAPSVLPGAGGSLLLHLWQASTDLGNVAYNTTGVASATENRPVCVRRYLTPAAGSYVYTWRGYRSIANGTVRASTGAGAGLMPGYIRVTSGG